MAPENLVAQPVIPDIERALSAVGDLLAARGHEVGIVILGGAAADAAEWVRTQDPSPAFGASLAGVVDYVGRHVD